MFQLSHISVKTDPKLLESCQASFKALLANPKLGFIHIPERRNLWQQCQTLADSWKKEVQHFVVLGIGGSSLGPQVITEALHKKNFTFVDNVDPIQFYHQLENLPEWNKIGWIVTSKSGTTMETLCALEMALQYGREKLGVTGFHRCVVISENTDNPLAIWARQNDFDRLEIPLDVGGRYSVLSPVGMFPAALSEADLERFRHGAEAALKNQQLVTELAAQTIMSFNREEWITVFWLYSARALNMGRWIQQLWAESLAKKINRSGQKAARVSTPIMAIGTTDQHSVLQQMMEGAADKFYRFFRFLDSENDRKNLQKAQVDSMKWLVGHSMGSLLRAEASATQKALEEEGRHTLTLEIRTLDESNLGYFFMMTELVVAVIAEQMNIDAFNQPGVELGKSLARKQFVSPS